MDQIYAAMSDSAGGPPIRRFPGLAYPGEETGQQEQVAGQGTEGIELMAGLAAAAGQEEMGEDELQGLVRAVMEGASPAEKELLPSEGLLGALLGVPEQDIPQDVDLDRSVDWPLLDRVRKTEAPRFTSRLTGAPGCDTCPVPLLPVQPRALGGSQEEARGESPGPGRSGGRSSRCRGS